MVYYIDNYCAGEVGRLVADQSKINTTKNTTRTYPPGYGVVEPVANYRPWDIDTEFQSVFERVRSHTMVDIYRLWILWVLAKQRRPGDVIEIGSWRGGSGALIALATNLDGAKSRVILADTFAGVVKAGERDTYYKGGEHGNTSPDLVRTFLDSQGLSRVELLVGMFPEETAAGVGDLRFSLAHIDVDVYQSARDAYDWLLPRMVPGGQIVFDDYGFYGCEGVTALVEEIMKEPDAVVLPNLSGQAIIVRT